MGEAGVYPLGALVGGHLGVGTVEEFVGVGCVGEIVAELDLPLGYECVEAADDGLICESLSLLELEDVAEGVEGVVFSAGGHDRGSLPRRVWGETGDGSPHPRGHGEGGH